MSITVGSIWCWKHKKDVEVEVIATSQSIITYRTKYGELISMTRSVFVQELVRKELPEDPRITELLNENTQLKQRIAFLESTIAAITILTKTV